MLKPWFRKEFGETISKQHELVIMKILYLKGRRPFFSSRLDKQIEQLEREQQEKMKMWLKKTGPLETWLIKKETVVESYEPIGYDISYVKGQSEDAQVGFASCSIS